MSGADPYRAPAADVAGSARVAGIPTRWRWVVAVLSLLQASMAMLWIRQDGGVLDLLRNGDMNFVTALPHMLSPLLLVLGAALLLARARGATAAFASAAILSAIGLALSSGQPLVTATAVVIALVAAVISLWSAPKRRAG